MYYDLLVAFFSFFVQFDAKEKHVQGYNFPENAGGSIEMR